MPIFYLLIYKDLIEESTATCRDELANYTNKWRISSWQNTKIIYLVRRTAFEVLEQVSHLAPLDKPVLIIGERGTGKELIASRLHYLSSVGKGRLFPLTARR